MKLLKKWFKKLQTNMGYTLIEVAAVVAVTATLGAIIVPIVVDKTKEAKLVAARAGTKAIGNAISVFAKDTGVWPAAAADTGTNTTFYAALRSGSEAGATTAAGTGHDPSEASGINGTWVTTNVDILNNHLVLDNAGGTADTTTPNGTYLVDLELDWKGPYSEPFKNTDPWGHNFLVYIKAMHTTTTGSSKEYGWIISAGPNGKLDTGIKDSVLKSDDIGYALFSAETGR